MSDSEGWLFGVYPTNKNEMSIFLKMESGDIHLLKDKYFPSIFVYGSSQNLEKLVSKIRNKKIVNQLSFENRKVKLGDLQESKVLKISCCSMDKIPKLAHKILSIGNYRDYTLYNVDLPYSQAYLQEKGLFPFAKIELSDFSNLRFNLLDSIEKTDYNLPPLKFAKLDIEPKTNGYTSNFENPIAKIRLFLEGDENTIEGNTEKEKILRLTNLIREENPDILLTEGGDSWDLPYLAKRAKINNISDDLILGREPRPFEEKDRDGVSYSSYGRVYYRPPPHYLKGRIHVDTQNSFIYEECGFQGLVELARVTRTPVQKTARSSIGSSMTNLQIYWAQKNDVLVPWKKSEPEDFKSGQKLLEADRGGFIYEPEIGFHEDVGEIDFSSFYPTIMKRYNISPETVLCDCCPNSDRKVPELGYNICERKRGLIPQVLDPILEKRRKYKKLVNKIDNDFKKRIYDNRQNALKWILVTCFGYLGYRNARFGRIEAHEAVTAFARKNLRTASRIAEEKDFKIVHGIVDSLWVKKSGVEKEKLRSLCVEIENEIDLPISIEGKYQWIVFPSSMESQRVPVNNRYYGVLENGELKTRGISARRSDTPEIVVKVQKEMLNELTSAENREEVEERVNDALNILENYINRIKQGSISLEELAIRKKLSREPNSYQNDVRSAIAAKKLRKAGINLHAGQQVSYIVTNASADKPHFRVKPTQLLERESKYDKDWYMEKLLAAASEILNPFSYRREKIREKVLEEGEQQKLL